MNEAIEKEQKKLADNLKNSTEEQFEKKGFALLCWLKGYECGFESAKEKRKQK